MPAWLIGAIRRRVLSGPTLGELVATFGRLPDAAQYVLIAVLFGLVCVPMLRRLRPGFARQVALALALVGLWQATGLVQGSNIYVAVCANNGNGSALSCAASPGGAGAYNDVQSAFTDATTPGDHVLIGDGTFDCASDGSGDADFDGGCKLAGSGGTSGNPIVITYATTPRGPVIRNTNTASPTTYTQVNNPTLNLTGRSYVSVLGLTIQGSIRVYNSPPTPIGSLALGLVIEGNEITRGWADPSDGNWSGIWLEGCRFSSVRGNYIHDITNNFTGAGSQSSLTGIKLYTCIDSLYEYNTVLNAYDISGESHAGGIDDKQDSIRNTHRYNDFKGVENCLRFQNQQAIGNATGTVVYGNLCRLGAAAATRYAVEFEDGSFTDLTIYNNTFAGGWQWGMHFTNSTHPAQGLRVYNNAFRGTFAGLNIDTEGGSNVTTNAWTLLDYNFYPDRNYRPRSSTHTARSAMFSAEGFEQHGCEVGIDAACSGWGFTNEAGDDYTLTAGSALRNAGRTGGTSGGSAVDIGYTGVTSCVGHLCTGSGWVAGGVGDTTAPVVTITAPTSSETYLYTVGNGFLTTLAGTCTDNVGATSVTWTNSAGGSGTASGTLSWSVNTLALRPGLNRITMNCADAAGNTHQAALDVTYQPGIIRQLRRRQ